MGRAAALTLLGVILTVAGSPRHDRLGYVKRFRLVRASNPRWWLGALGLLVVTVGSYTIAYAGAVGGIQVIGLVLVLAMVDRYLASAEPPE